MTRMTIGDTEWTTVGDASGRMTIRRTYGGYMLLVESSTFRYWVNDTRGVVAFGTCATLQQAMRDAIAATRDGRPTYE